MSPERQAGTVVKFYSKQSKPARAHLVRWLSGLRGQANGSLLDLLANILRRLPPEPSLANAIRDKIGVRELERRLPAVLPLSKVDDPAANLLSPAPGMGE